MKSFFTTALLLSASVLGGATKSPEKTSKLLSSEEKELLENKTALSYPEGNLHIIGAPAPSEAQNQLILLESIRPLMGGNPTEESLNKITNAITQATTIDPVIDTFIHLVIDNLPGFKIKMCSEEEIGMPDTASYRPISRIMLLPNNVPQKQLVFLIIQQFWYAAMATVQLGYSKDPWSMEYCFPETEKKWVEKYFEEGDKNISYLIKLLEKSSLTAEEKNTLENLRALSKMSYDTYYKINTPSISDPLEAAIITIAEINAQMKEDKDHKNYFVTKLSYLYQSLPVPLIEALFPELFDYTEELINKTYRLFNKETFADKMEKFLGSQNKINWGETLHDIVHGEVDYLLSLPEEAITLSKTEAIFPIVSHNIKHDQKLLESQSILKKIVKKNILVGEASLMLGSIAYKQKNYKKACEHYAMAVEHKTNFSVKELYYYAESLRKTQDYKLSRKYCQNALKIPGLLEESEKSKFETLLQAINEDEHRAPHRQLRF